MTLRNPWTQVIPALLCAAAAASGQSPVNQVFQFMQSGDYSAWADGARSKATAYLWIPEKSKRLRGLLILGQNVPEHRLAGHPAIREVCARNDLGIVWITPTFWRRTGTENEPEKIVAFLQQLLDGLAKVSGYDEVATVPWLPMGESMHLMMVDALVEAAPERCIAGIWIKNTHFPPKNRTTPALITHGTAQEWTQDKADLRERWKDVSPYESVLAQRKDNPAWPVSFVIDGHSGHFECSERLVRYFAHYIDRMAKARLSKDGSMALRPLSLDRGYVADLPVPGHEKHPAIAYAKAAKDQRGLPWYSDGAGAREAQSFAAINWNAESQLPAFADAGGSIAPFTHNGISDLTPEMEEDGITFTLRPVMLERIPGNFADAGEPLARASGTPSMEWLCGPVSPLGNDRFQIALDRSFPQSPVFLAARQGGTDSIRAAVQPVSINLRRNREGKAQSITFPPIADVTAGTRSIPLAARADSGLPVGFFVVAGPAMVQGGMLVFTKLPPRTRLPVTVTVAAWQWGRSAEPKIQEAVMVKRTFRIVAAR